MREVSFTQTPVGTRAQSVLDWIEWLKWLTDPEPWAGRLRANVPYFYPSILIHRIEDELDKRDQAIFTKV